MNEITVKITPNEKGNPLGKLADAELHFPDGRPLTGQCPQCEHYGHDCICFPLAGLKLIGFGIWERRGGLGRNVTFPARQYSINGERRSFALLRPIVDTTAQERIRNLILAAYQDLEKREHDAADHAHERIIGA